MKIRYLFIAILSLIFCVICKNGRGQKQGQEKIDSLFTNLTNYKSECNKPCLKDSSKVKLILQLGKDIAFINFDTSLVLANDALSISKAIAWQTGIAQSYHFTGYLYSLKGEYKLTKDYYLKAIDIWVLLEKKVPENQKSGILISKNKTISNLAIIYNNQGEYPHALDCYFNCLKIDEQLNNKAGISKDLIGIGFVYGSLGDPHKALDYYFKALQIEEQAPDKNRMSSAFGDIGVEYDELGDYEKALEYYLKALKIFEELGDTYKISNAYLNIGTVYGKQKQYDRAKIFLLKALDMAKKNKDMWSEANILSSLGTAYANTKSFDTAKGYLLRGIKLAETTGDISVKYSLNQTISDVYFGMNNFKKALEYYKIAMIAKDSLFNKEKYEQITQKNMTYEFEKKQDSTKAVQDKKNAVAQQEIEKQKLIRNTIIGGSAGLSLIGLLAFINFRNKRKREKAELSLQVSETEMKALRSQMNPHFIFNALQSIQTFLLNNKSEDANIYLLKFSKLMRAVLENSQHSEVPLKDDIQALELYMQLESIRLTHPFTYQFHFDETVDTENDTIPPLILQPFVENAIWHGLQYKPEPGHINIYLSKKDNALNAIVEDNGIGRDMSKQVAQPMLLKKESLGMKLTEERLKVLNELKKTNAMFTIIDLFTKNNEPSGTKVELLLPLVS